MAGCVVWLTNGGAASLVQVSAGGQIKVCTLLSSDRPWYDSCTVSNNTSQMPNFAAGSAQTGRQWRKCTPTEGHSPSHFSTLPAPSSSIIHLYYRPRGLKIQQSILRRDYPFSCAVCTVQCTVHCSIDYTLPCTEEHLYRI